MNKISPYFQYHLMNWYHVFVLSVYSISITVYCIKSSNEVKIVAIDQFGTRLVTEKNDKIYQTEKYEFVKYFIRNYTNYDSENFSQTIGHSTDLMTDEVWNKIENEYKILKDRVKETKLIQISEITKLEEDDKNSNQFKAEIISQQNYRGIQKKIKGEIQLILNFKKRTELNPYGWEVSSLYEKWD